MELGVHLPLVDLGTGQPSFARLGDAVDAASDCGFTTVAANDHLVFARPWLDGPTALASVIERSGRMTLAMTAALPVVRGPVALAKTLGAIDLLSGGRLVAALAPGSSPRDHAAVGLDFDERWTRFDEAIVIMRALLDGAPLPETARHYPVPADLELEPRRPRVPLWVASWGSPAGLRRVAEWGDGWLASAYNTTPERFAAARAQLADMRDLPNSLATMWTWVTGDAAEAERVLTGTLAPLLRRDPEELRGQVCVGSPEHCARLLSAYARAGCERVLLWPLGDEPRQLERVAEEVVPLLTSRRPSGGSRASR